MILAAPTPANSGGATVAFRSKSAAAGVRGLNPRRAS